jgi:hypothetical protein
VATERVLPSFAAGVLLCAHVCREAEVLRQGRRKRGRGGEAECSTATNLQTPPHGVSCAYL